LLGFQESLTQVQQGLLGFRQEGPEDPYEFRLVGGGDKHFPLPGPKPSFADLKGHTDKPDILFRKDIAPHFDHGNGGCLDAQPFREFALAQAKGLAERCQPALLRNRARKGCPSTLREGASLEFVQKITALPAEIIQNLTDREIPQYGDRV
jgi:hypothetical protein